MKRSTFRAGAVASVTMLFAALFGSEIDGALAQDSLAADQTEPIMLETVETKPASQDEAAEAPMRFVAGEVVEPLPDQAQDAAEPAPVRASSLRQLVDTMPAGGELSTEMTCLAQAVYFESRGEPLDGQLAVARVVINRTESSLFPDDYCSVVTQRAQFSFVRTDASRQPKPAHWRGSGPRQSPGLRIRNCGKRRRMTPCFSTQPMSARVGPGPNWPARPSTAISFIADRSADGAARL